MKKNHGDTPACRKAGIIGYAELASSVPVFQKHSVRIKVLVNSDITCIIISNSRYYNPNIYSHD